MLDSAFVLGLSLLLATAVFGSVAQEFRGRVVGGRPAESLYRRGIVLIYRRRDGTAYKHCTGYRLGVLPGGSARDVGHGELVDTGAIQEGVVVRKAYVHKRYGNFAQADRRFDVAVLVLARRLSGFEYRKVVLGDVRSRPLPRRVLAVGYGVTSEFGQHPGELRKTVVVARDFKWCRRHEENKKRLQFLERRRQFCATSIHFPKGVTDTCYGDSGGPLFEISTHRSLFQIGITSFSFGDCAQPGSTPWYVRIWTFRKAIDKLLRQGRYKSSFFKFVESKEGERILARVPSEDGVDLEDLDDAYGLDANVDVNADGDDNESNPSTIDAPREHSPSPTPTQTPTPSPSGSPRSSASDLPTNSPPRRGVFGLLDALDFSNF